VTIDAIIFDLEVEANILRAVSHLEPDAACEFLLNLVRKIRQAPRARRARVLPPPPLREEFEEDDADADDPVDPSPGSEVATPGPLAAPPSPQGGGRRPNRSQTIINVLQAHGPMSKSRMFELVSEQFGEPCDRRNQQRINSLLWQLVAKNRVLQEETEDFDQVLSLPRLGPLSLLGATLLRPETTSSSETTPPTE